jgi:hypothetical protein
MIMLYRSLYRPRWFCVLIAFFATLSQHSTALARGKHTLAVDAFETAVDMQDTLKYIEPPDWVPSMRCRRYVAGVDLLVRFSLVN